MKTEFSELGFFTYKPSPLDSVFIHWNRVHWTGFLFDHMSCRSLKLSKHVSQKTHSPLTQKTHSLSHSFPLSVSLSLSLHSILLRFTLIPSCSGLSLSFPLTPSLSVSLTLIPFPAAPSLSPLYSVAIAPPFRRHRCPNNRRVSFSFDLFYVVFGFYIIVWMIVWIVFVF